jgi:hypothetical protein
MTDLSPEPTVFCHPNGVPLCAWLGCLDPILMRNINEMMLAILQADLEKPIDEQQFAWYIMMSNAYATKVS